MGPPAPEIQEPAVLPIPAVAEAAEPRGTPELSVRTDAATTAPVDRRAMVAAEARRRNFAAAAARAFLGDGSAWIWGLHRRSFPTFVAIVHFLPRPGPTSSRRPGSWSPTPRAAGSHSRPGRRPAGTGGSDRVIAELRTWCDTQIALCGCPLERLADDDPRRIVARVLGYLEDNRERMDYPRYRLG